MSKKIKVPRTKGSAKKPRKMSSQAADGSQQPSSPATEKRLHFHVRNVCKERHTWYMITDLAPQRARVSVSGGDPGIDIGSPSPGTTEQISLGAFTVSGNVQPPNSTLTVVLAQSDGSYVQANPFHPQPDPTTGNWSTSITPTVTGSATLNAGALFGSGWTGATEPLTITK